MIDRFSDTTHAFTVRGAEVVINARAIKDASAHQLLSPIHIGAALVDHYLDAFGDKNIQEDVKESLIDWETHNPAKPGEVDSFLQVAKSYAQSDTGRVLIRDKDLLRAMLMPGQHLPPLGPLAFFRGDTDSSLSYRQSILSAIGEPTGDQYFGSPAYYIAQDAIARNFSRRLAKAG